MCVWPLKAWLPLGCHQAVSEAMPTLRLPTCFHCCHVRTCAYHCVVQACVGKNKKKIRRLILFGPIGVTYKLMAVNERAFWVDVQCSRDANPLCVAASSDIRSSHNLPISVAIFSLTSLYSPLYTGQPVASLGGFNINWVWAAPQGCLIAL